MKEKLSCSFRYTVTSHVKAVEALSTLEQRGTQLVNVGGWFSSEQHIVLFHVSDNSSQLHSNVFVKEGKWFC